MHPRSGHWQLIDNITTRQRDLSNFFYTHAVCGANCSMDHTYW